MKQARWLLPCLLLLLGAASAGGAPSLRPFGPNSLPEVVTAKQNQRFLLVLWSIHCAPCLKEFQAFQELRKAGVTLPLVLVATDTPMERADVEQVLARFGLNDSENWIFADDNAQRLRYAIDPAWYGEMPRSYLYESDGTRTSVSGGLSKEQLVAWLQR